ncbi:MAG: ModD protein [Formivibrio sp.]|nr:ModD protein [Formivibrio sp.]
MHQIVLTDTQLHALLHEDVPYGDLTTATLNIGEASGQLTFSARNAMTVCAIEEAARLLELAGLSVTLHCQSGMAVEAGTLLLHAQGKVCSLHRGWKIAQILVETTSGIASAMAQIVGELAQAGLNTPVACTRKNLPGTKALSCKAIRAGGGSMHRLGLSETILIFPEHRLFLHESPAETVMRLKAALPEKKIVVEVKDMESARTWADAGVDVLQLEKFSVHTLADCAQQLSAHHRRPSLAAAGGVNAQNAVAYAKAGADLLVTSAPYYAKPADVQVTFTAER